MNQLIGCIKKELIEMWRKKRLVLFVAFTLSFMFVSFLATALSGVSIDELMDGARPTASFYMIMTMYYAILLITMTSGSVAREVKDKKLVIPLSNGMEEKNIIGSKLIVHGLFAFFSTLIFMLISTSLDVAFYGNQGNYFLNYFIDTLKLSFANCILVLLCISLSAITKSSGISAVSAIVVMMIIPIIAMNSAGFKDALPYTPFLFFGNGFFTLEGVEAWMYGVCIAQLVVIYVPLIYFALTQKNLLYMGKNG